jgi:site-specific DNA-methyltransferase (adenine-specific)
MKIDPLLSGTGYVETTKHALICGHDALTAGGSLQQSLNLPIPPYHLHAGDAVEWLRTIPAASVDLVVTDPPYESLEKHRSIGTTTRLKHSKSSSNDWFSIFPNSRFEELFREVWRVLKRNTHFYLFCDAATMFVAKPIAESVGFRFWKPLVWDKKKIGMGYHYRSRCEFILFFEKGKRKILDLGIPDILEAPRILHGYPTEKPVAISRVLISQSSVPGELVLDPFMGAGSVGVASVELGRQFHGNDLSANAVAITSERLVAAMRASDEREPGKTTR